MGATQAAGLLARLAESVSRALGASFPVPVEERGLPSIPFSPGLYFSTGPFALMTKTSGVVGSSGRMNLTPKVQPCLRGKKKLP
jgi:hypothetical protein